MSKDEKNEPSFPEPFEPFNQDMDMAANIEQLRLAEQNLERLNNDLEQAQKNIKDIGPFDSRHNNLYDTVSLYQEQIRETQQVIPTLRAKTYGVFERFFEEHKVEPELANQVMQVLDEKVYPEKQENRTQEEDREVNQETIPIEQQEGKSEIANPVLESHEINEHINNPESSTKENDYTLSLFVRKKEEQAKLHSGVETKDAEIDKNVIQNSGYLNYQLKLQKPVFKERSKEELVKDFFKNTKDISKDKD